MKLFGNTVKFLLAQRGLTAKELAERVNLSETSVSKIVNGVTKPRQANFTRIIQELCATPDEEQQLVSAYAQIEEGLEDEQKQVDPAVYERLEKDRVRRYLQAKSQSIAFREQADEVRTQSGVPFQGPHQNQEIICDFFILGPPRIAIECKANSKRDWDRTLTSAKLFRAELHCERVLVITTDEFAELDAGLRQRLEKSDVEIVHLSKLGGYLRARVANG